MASLLFESSPSIDMPRTLDLSPTLNATSAVKKAGMSITLPRNFAPLSLDASEAPRTPDQTFAQLELPPPPHHSTFRIQRPRLNLDNFRARNNALPPTLFASEIPIPSSAGPLTTEFAKSSYLSSDDAVPSIETLTPTRPQLLQSYSEPMSSHRLRLQSMAALPQTPPAQTNRLPVDIKRDEWDLHRASSVCSHHSDSSLSTTETYETRPTSYDGSVAGAEAELADPFSPTDNIKVIPATPVRKSKKPRMRGAHEWTIEMDNHLFNVYQMYLADPKVTPFKTVPGSIPPTGVCHRVARRARETWPRASRIDVPIVQRYKLRNMLDVRMTPRAKTPDLENFLTTNSENRRPSWPNESATRKRLKQLCREKFTITAHYNRLRESRSPSPFADQFLPRRPSPLSTSPRRNHNDEEDRTYATRELHINLVATGATEPLAQLTTGDSPLMDSALHNFNRAQDAADMVPISQPLGLGIEQRPVAMDDSKLAPVAHIPRLASPFTYNTWNGPVRPENHHRRQVSQNHFDTMHVTGPRLLSPFQPEADIGLNANKRRAQNNLEDELSPSGSSLAGHTSGLNLEEPLPLIPEPKQELIFTGLGDLNQRRVRVRNRGATLGTAQERIARLFAPPPQQDHIPPVPEIPSQFAAMGDADMREQTLMPPKVEEGQRRLGSPFELDPNKRSYRVKPRHLPSLSDPFIKFTHEAPSSNIQPQDFSTIGERLASFQQSLNDYKPQQL